MPGRLVMNGVQREFMFHEPAGWRYWLGRPPRRHPPPRRPVLHPAPTPFTPNEDPSIQAGRPEVSVFDPDRRFLFGRGDGGMMALRQIHEDPPDTWAAAWIQSGAIGGRQDLRGVWPVVHNSPDPGGVATMGTSLVAHHGAADLDVPPQGEVGEVRPSDGRTQELREAGMPEVHVGNFTSGYLSLATMLRDYRALNRLLRSAPEDHWNFYNDDPPSVTPADIWGFFKAHPRTRL